MLAERESNSTVNSHVEEPPRAVPTDVVMRTHFTRLVHEGDDQDLVCSCKLLNSHTLWLKVVHCTVLVLMTTKIEWFIFLNSERSPVGKWRNRGHCFHAGQRFVVEIDADHQSGRTVG